MRFRCHLLRGALIAVLVGLGIGVYNCRDFCPTWHSVFPANEVKFFFLFGFNFL